MLFLDQRDIGRLVFVIDTLFFFAGLVVYKIILYKLYLTFHVQKSRVLARQLVGAALLAGPLSIAVVVTARHGFAAWVGSDQDLYLTLLALSAALRPLVVLFRPIFSRPSTSEWLLKEGRKLILVAVAGSSLMVCGAILLNQRGLGRADILADLAIFLAVMTWVGVRQNRAAERARLAAAGARETPEVERLLVVGSGIELGAYIAALAALPDHQFEVAGVVTPHSEHRTTMVGKYPVLGELRDIPEIIGIFRVSRVVVVRSSLAKADIEFIESRCSANHLLHYVHPLLPIATPAAKSSAGPIALESPGGTES